MSETFVEVQCTVCLEYYLVDYALNPGVIQFVGKIYNNCPKCPDTGYCEE